MASSALKGWLIRKVRRLFGIDELLQGHRALEDRLHQFLDETVAARDERKHEATTVAAAANELARQLQNVAERLPSRESSLVGEAFGRDAAAALEQLEKQGLFVLGSARSGTSILTKCLNLSPEIFLLEEPNFFQNVHIEDFASFFNAMHRAFGSAPYKGTYVAPPVAAESGPLDLMARLCRQYRYAGAKVAVGPHDYPAEWKRLYLDFHAKYFLRSRHFLTFRRPNETVWSMHKLFPDSPIERLFEAWLESVSLALDVYQVCPNSHLLFFDDFGTASLERLADLLGIEIRAPESMLGGVYVRSRLQKDELPPPLAPYAELCRDCNELFEDLRGNVCRDSFAYCGPAGAWYYFGVAHQHIQELLERTRASAEPGRAAA